MGSPEHGIVVVGAGHAGCEAALAAARMGVPVVVVTLHAGRVAEMPCNPAMGGVGKGHIMAELDALGGVQPWAADRSGIQFRMLNRSRGPAVWGPRAQCDKADYSRRMARILGGVRGIRVVEGEAVGLLVGDEGVRGVLLAGGERLRAACVVLSTGTFLGGILHTGPERRPGGRFGEAPSVGLGRALEGLGLELRRYKTGTPPRLHRESLDMDRLEVQAGDDEPRPFSWRTASVRNRAVCWITRTPPVVQRIIGDNLHRSPLFAGVIEGTGPRYCPSIEDKVVRFPHHDEHTVFLEPEGLDTPSVYVNGLSTSLPRDVQEAVVHAVPGLEGARFLRYGYAVEYDVVPAAQVRRNLEVRGVDGLFLAGQLLGTSGYEEAAALGFLAGVNAVARLRGERPLVLGREEAYMGVLVDDLVGRDQREPYRMLTGRAEHRLILGVDSARERLMGRGVKLGLVPERVFHVERSRWERREDAVRWLEESTLNPNPETRTAVREVAGIEPVRQTTWAAVVRRQDVDPERLIRSLPQLAALGVEDARVVVSRVRYAGYLERHRREVERLKRLGSVVIPRGFLDEDVPGLSLEVREVLRRSRPETLAEAERLPGMTPAAMAVLVSRLAGRGADRG